MLQSRTFTADDFEQAPRGRRLFDLWRAKHPLENTIGPFEVEMDATPDEELLRVANELAALISADYDAILNAIYEHYLRCAEDRFWMKSCEVPRRLRVDQVKGYLRSRSISVRRDPQGAARGSIHLSPQWDPEHGIVLGVVNGRWVPQQS